MPSWQNVARRVRVPTGFVVAAIYLWLAKPDLPFLTIGAVFVIGGLLLRAAASGQLKKNEQLATGGPYAYTRNPLYLGSLVMAVGFAIAARSIWVIVIIAAVFIAIYLPVIRGEEEYLAARFPEFADYSRRVPRIFPSLRRFEHAASSFRWQLYRKHREYNAVLGALAMLAALVGKLYWHSR